MSITKDNFFVASEAVWRTSTAPDSMPDYTSYFEGKPSSQYWYIDGNDGQPIGVIRLSDHWGRGINACNWHHESLGVSDSIQRLKTPIAGVCLWDEFKPL